MFDYLFYLPASNSVHVLMSQVQCKAVLDVKMVQIVANNFSTEAKMQQNGDLVWPGMCDAVVA